MDSDAPVTPNLTANSTLPVSGSNGDGYRFELDRGGAAWRLRLVRDGIEVGGGIFGDDDYGTALEEGQNWISVPPEGWPD